MYKATVSRKSWRVTLAGVLVTATAFGAAAIPSDQDQDGINDRVDLCPATAAGLKVVSHGCSALEIALAPEVILEAVNNELRPNGPSLSAAADRLTLASAELRRGDFCGAAALAGGITRDLETERREIEETAARAAREQRESPGVAMLPSLVSSIAIDLAAEVEPFFAAACAEVEGPWSGRGKVTEVRDAERRFRFEKSGWIGLAEGYYEVGPIVGEEIEVSGIAFADGSRLATSVVAKAPAEDFAKVQQCLELRIAPFQPFPPYEPSGYNPVLHFPEAYANNWGVLDLERKQRFGAVDVGCPGPAFGTSVSYAMKIDVTQNGNTWTLASNLQDGDTAVDLPAAWVDNTTGQVSATVRKTTCYFLTGTCSTTTLGTHTLGIFVRPLGTYATLVYDKTLFDVGGNILYGDFERAKVTGFNLSVIGSGNTPYLQARGYESPSVSEAETSADWISLNEYFAIRDFDNAYGYYDDEMYDETKILLAAPGELLRTGVDRPSGLVWPQVKGYRDYKLFTYSAKVPTIVRDRITNCAGSLDSHYEMPFNGTATGLVQVTVGNFDDPVTGHSGTASFALDFSGPSNWPVYGARAGVVYQEAVGYSTNATEPGLGAIGNYILVKHQDGTWGLYYHLAQNSSPANIFVGQRIDRDWHLANFGLLKLHFEVGNDCHPIGCPSVSGYNSVKVLYLASVKTMVSPGVWTSTDKTCYVPKVGDKL